MKAIRPPGWTFPKRVSLAWRLLLALLLLAFSAHGSFSDAAVVHFIVFVPPGFDDVKAVEFRVDNLPLGACTIEEHWDAPLVVGDLDDQISLAFYTPRPAPIVYLGHVVFIAHEEVGDDYAMKIERGIDAPWIIVVDGNLEEHRGDGWWHTFNCDGNQIPYCYCDIIISGWGYCLTVIWIVCLSCFTSSPCYNRTIGFECKAVHTSCCDCDKIVTFRWSCLAIFIPPPCHNRSIRF